MKLKIFSIAFIALTATITAFGKTPLPEPDFVLPVEYTSDKLSNDLTGDEYVTEKGACHNITKAEISVYLPETPIPDEGYPCVLIFPGGGYAFVNIRDAGIRAAEFYTSLGIAAVVVKYRLPNGHWMVPVLDGQQAIRMVRMNAEKWGINPSKTGITGSSAGGHLASMLAAHIADADDTSPHELDHYSSRPDFLILVKAVINESKGGTMSNIQGKNPSTETIKSCNALHYADSTSMPTFIAHCTDDPAAPVNGVIELYCKLKDAGVPVEMHIFNSGRHGLGYIDKKKPMDSWKGLVATWLTAMHVI